MSGGSQHNPNGRQAQLGAGWSPLQLQVASYLARAPQAHMASERGVTWHTPTPPHMYHVPAPSPPDHLQAMKGGAPAVFRHTATPPDLYRHTPTPPDKHLHRHTPSPGDPKGVPLPPEGLFPHLAPSRDKLRPEDILSFARVTSGAGGGGGVDLTLGRGSNGAPLALSVRDAPTINSLIARAPRHRVDSLLERLAPQPPQPPPPSVIVPPRALPTPSPPSSNEDSVDSNSSSKRKRKPERVLRVPIPDPPREIPPPQPLITRLEPPPPPEPPKENGTTPPEPVTNGPPIEAQKPVTVTHARRKTRSGSAETIDDIAAMIASERVEEPEPRPATPPQSVDKLKSVLASPEPEKPEATPATVAAAPRRRSTRLSNSEATNVPVESPSEAKPAEPEPSASAEPTAASFVEVENELEKMFAGIEGEEKRASEKSEGTEQVEDPPSNKRRKSLPTKAEKKARAKSNEPKRKPGRKKGGAKQKKAKAVPLKDAYDSGSNASSGRSRGPYIQIRGPRDSPLSVSVINACGGAGEEEVDSSRRRGDFRNGSRRGLHCSTLGLRYDAATPDATWLCVFCNKGPHAEKLGDLFGPYQLEVSEEVWFHAECGVWAPGLVAAGARLWGLDDAVRTVRAERCAVCGAGGAGVACSARACPRRVHLPCARSSWLVDEEALAARCPAHA